MPTVDSPAKARSRLNPERKESLQKQTGRGSASLLSSLKAFFSQHSTHSSQSAQLAAGTSTRAAVATSSVSPRLIIASLTTVAGVAAVWYILTQIHPAEVANVFFYRSYAPLLLLIFVTLCASSMIVTRSLRRAVLFALPLVILLFFQLQSISLTPLVLLAVLGTLWGTEVIFSLAFRS